MRVDFSAGVATLPSVDAGTDWPQLLGVDGGATAIRAWRLGFGRGGWLEAVGEPVERPLHRLEGFRPVPLAAQLDERRQGRLRIGAIEEAQGLASIRAAADAIAEAARRGGEGRVLLGLCMPGLKSANRRGIAVMRHGPRIPGFLDRLEEALAGCGLECAPRPARLMDDGEAAGWGEEAGCGGRFGDVGSALLIASGTGVAEALKLKGRLAPAREHLAPPWELTAPDGALLEDRASMSGLCAEWTRRSGSRVPPFPEDRAIAGDPIAREVLRGCAIGIADLVFERIQALASSEGGAVLERVVLGQHAARLFADEALAPLFRGPLERRLAGRIAEEGEDALGETWLAGDDLEPGRLAPSRLRAAPAIGAVAVALRLDARRVG